MFRLTQSPNPQPSTLNGVSKTADSVSMKAYSVSMKAEQDVLVDKIMKLPSPPGKRRRPSCSG